MHSPEQPFAEEIYVDMDEEWHVSTEGSDLMTEGLGPCVGIALIDHQKGIAALGHFIAPRHCQPRIIDDIRDFLRLTDPKRVQVVVRGGAPIDASDTHYEQTLHDRQAVMQAFDELELPREQIDIVWLERTDQYVNMTVSVEKGQVGVEVEDLEVR